MSDRRPSPFKTLLDSDVCTLIQAAENVYQIRFKNPRRQRLSGARQHAHHH